MDEEQRRSCLLNNQRLRPWLIASILNPKSESTSDIVCILSYHLLNCNEALTISLRVFCNELHRNYDLGHKSGSKPCWLAEHVTMDTHYKNIIN
ncbi:hypothetical protein T07_14236 [Trichinella nelsoni]|uniref:Uncharacterized protein n=1 Tax=Trichinella nelsoni TaxID=6336 RepID=A0A0V0SJI6_9BILA|nr:hypothetical protein T07_14236 [Trichinella nelsoni]